MTTSADVRAQIVNVFRRDLVGPGPEDQDLATERLNETPSRWYLTGFLAPADDPLGLNGGDADDDPSAQDEMEIEVDEVDTEGAGGAAGDADPPEASNAKRRFLPSSVGLTVLLPPEVTEIEARVCWGDYRTEPPLPENLLAIEAPAEEAADDAKPKRVDRPSVDWVRAPKERVVRLPVPDGRGRAVIVPERAGGQRKGGALTLEAHARLFTYPSPNGGNEQVRALTVFLVNRRASVHRFYADMAFVFQAELELVCKGGFKPRRDISAYRAPDEDLRIVDLHYRDVCEYAVGRNGAAGWNPAEEQAGLVTHVWTDPLPQAEVERVAPNEDEELKEAVTFGMEALASRAEESGAALSAALALLPALYGRWIDDEGSKLAGLAERRRETAETLIAHMTKAQQRIAAGIDILASNAVARSAFRFMNLAVAEAARRRNAGTGSNPAALPEPTWRPFQLAFILMNLPGLVDHRHADREIADLLFFPTGGGKTEAYLGLAAFVIAFRRLSASGLLGAGVAVIMRYTLRLLTLDQLARAAGVICALELMRTNQRYQDANGRPMLGTWPIEIAYGSARTPRRIGSAGGAMRTKRRRSGGCAVSRTVETSAHPRR